jgi:hypothetical protein
MDERGGIGDVIVIDLNAPLLQRAIDVRSEVDDEDLLQQRGLSPFQFAEERAGDPVETEDQDAPLDFGLAFTLRRAVIEIAEPEPLGGLVSARMLNLGERRGLSLSGNSTPCSQPAPPGEISRAVICGHSLVALAASAASRFVNQLD